MLAAVVLVWVGRELPESLGYTCLSMEGVVSARLVLIYEAACRQSVPWSCFDVSSVVTHEICDGCVASMHTQRIEEAGYVTGGSTELSRVLEMAPQVLAELKPTWGYVFSRFLSDFTHWTYTDADVVFGALDLHLKDIVDVETWSFEGDAARLFLRGQFSLHRNADDVNLLWTRCSHLSSRFQENIRYKLDFFKNRRNKRLERRATDARMQPKNSSSCQPNIAKFVSAEACYSCVVFRQSYHLTKRILPVVLSDHDDAPVRWTRSRGLCRARTRCQAAPPPLSTRHFFTGRGSRLVVESCFDMQWLCRSTQSAGLRVSGEPLGEDDAVEMFGTNVTVYRQQRQPPPLFHFRKWADYGKFETVPLPSRGSQRGFVVQATGIRPL